MADRAFLATRLGMVLHGAMQMVEGGGSDECVGPMGVVGAIGVGSGLEELTGAIEFFVGAAPDVGVAALVGVVDGLGESDGSGYAWTGVLCAVMRMGRVCGAIKERVGELVGDGGRAVDVVGSFRAAAARTFVAGDVNTSITFSHLVMQYGPESQRQWGMAMLYALYVHEVYARCTGRGGVSADGSDSDCRGQKVRVDMEQAYAALNDATKEHPFVMMVRLFELKEQGDHDSDIAQLVDSIVSAASRDPKAWPREYVCALNEIDGSIMVPVTNDEAAEGGPLEVFLRTVRKMECGLMGCDMSAFKAFAELVRDGTMRAAYEDALQQLKELASSRRSDAGLQRKIAGVVQVVMVPYARLESSAEARAVEDEDFSDPNGPTEAATLEMLRPTFVAFSRSFILLLRSSKCDHLEGYVRDLERVLAHLAVKEFHGRLSALFTDTVASGRVNGEKRKALSEPFSDILRVRNSTCGDSSLCLSCDLAHFSYDLASRWPLGRVDALGGMEDDPRYAYDLHGILHTMGDEFFVEFISVNMRLFGIGVKHVPLLQYVADTIHGGLEAIVTSVARSHGAGGSDDMGSIIAYSIYSIVIQRLKNVPPSIGEALMVTEETTPQLAIKVCHLEPWKYGGYICDAWNEGCGNDEEEGGDTGDSGGEASTGSEGGSTSESEDESESSESIEAVTTRSLPRAHSLSQEEIESPATTRKRKLSAAEHVISCLIDDLAVSSGEYGQCTRGENHPWTEYLPARTAEEHSEQADRASPWIKWVKRIFSP